MAPAEMYAKLKKLYTGAMKGRTMYVIPLLHGRGGFPLAKYGIELTDSIYVVLSMHIMTRAGKEVIPYLDENFIKGLHARANLDPEERYIVQFPEDNAIMSINSNYGGNVLLGKKCFALRIASYLGRREGWMAEHMLILGIQNPQGEVRYLAAAFPSACGKTNLAMLIPPEHYRKAGWKCLVRGGRYRLAAHRSGRPAVGHEPGIRLLRRGAPAPMPSPTPTPWLPPGRTPSSPTLRTTWRTTPCGGKSWTSIPGKRPGLDGKPLESQNRPGSCRPPQHPLHRPR